MVRMMPVIGKRFIEGVGDVDGVLAGHRVDDQKDFIGVDRGLDALQLLHQRFVDVEAAGGVDDHQVVAVVAGVI